MCGIFSALFSAYLQTKCGTTKLKHLPIKYHIKTSKIAMKLLLLYLNNIFEENLLNIY